jgi:hypothetical protein
MSKLLDEKRFYRNGRDHRGGWLVGFSDVKKHFGFQSLQVGKWVTKAEKEVTAPLFFDALSDLQDILEGPNHLISLRESLSLAYGKGGQQGVMAHYVPASKTFALAKNAGPGAIAHEWFHAFDHYMSDKLLKKKTHQFSSESYWEGAKARAHPLNDQLARCFDTIFYRNAQADLSDYVQRSLRADKEDGQKYYSLPYELTARAFEAFVQDAHIKNNFLASGTKQSADAKRGLYPQGDHRLQISYAFSRYFKMLGQALYRERARLE